MKKQLSNNLRIATLVMGITLSATVNAQNLLCVILDGDQTNDAIAILQVSKLGIARGALCYLDLTTTTTLENCHAVTGTVTGVHQIKIGLQGPFLGEDGQVRVGTAAFTYTPTAIDQGKGSVLTFANKAAKTGMDDAAVEGRATPVLCKAKKARRPQEAGYYTITLSANPAARRAAYSCPLDVAATFTMNLIPRPSASSWNMGGTQ